MSAGPHIEQRRECWASCDGNCRPMDADTDPDWDPEPCAVEYAPKCCTWLVPANRSETAARITLRAHLAHEHGMTVNPDTLPIIPREDT